MINTINMKIEDMKGIIEIITIIIILEAEDLNAAFYRKYYGVSVNNPTELAKFHKKRQGEANGDQGWCIVDSLVKTRCLEQGSLAHYDENMNDCVLSDEWYSSKCRALGGTYSGSSCEITNTATLEGLLNGN